MPTLPQLLHTPQCRPHWRVLLAALVVGVGAAALAPGADAPSLGIGDKLDHVLAFVALAVAAVLSWPASQRHAAAVAISLLAYGACIEIAQTQVPGRHGDLADLAVDALGVAAGLALAHALRRGWPLPRA